MKNPHMLACAHIHSHSSLIAGSYDDTDSYIVDVLSDNDKNRVVFCPFICFVCFWTKMIALFCI